jgi:hypothetical protein
MRQEIREEQRVINDRYTVYIADDGKEFTDRSSCVIYENKIKREKALEHIKKYIIEELDGQIPIHASAEFSEFMYYTWLKVNNEEERMELENLIEDSIESSGQYPLYVCYETEEEFEGIASDYSYTIEESMDITRKYFGKFGIEVEFKRG